MDTLDRLPAGARVLVVRLRSLGDCVLTTPALELLGRHRPDLSIGVVVERRFRAVFEGNPHVAERLDPAVAEVARFRPALTLNLHGGTRSLVLTLASRARYRAGFAHFRHQWAYNVRIPRAQRILGEERTVHTAEHAASAMFYLGVPRGEVPRASLSVRPVSQGRARAVLHPFASAPDKTWPPERFAAVARHLVTLGLEPLFIGAADDDFTPFQGFAQRRGAPLAEAIAAIGGASVFIGNDSGPAHIAAAFGLPTVVLFGASDAQVWAPWKTPAQVLTADGSITNISAARVIEAVERLAVRA